MEKLNPLEPKKELVCPHRSWTITHGDEEVQGLPKGEVILIHACEQHRIWQDYKGIKRYYGL